MGSYNLQSISLFAFCVLGCLSYGKETQGYVTVEHLDLPEVMVETDEPELETLPNGCVSTIAELSLPFFVSANDEHLLTDGLIVVRKEVRKVMVFTNGQLRHDRPGNQPSCWRVGLGWNPVFDKMGEGDGRTPEGLFRTSDKPWSNFQGAIAVHYPSEYHAQRALRAKRIKKSTYYAIVRALAKGTLPPQNTALGGEILLHGGGSSSDWTAGCAALSDADLDELRSHLPPGMNTWVLILP